MMKSMPLPPFKTSIQPGAILVERYRIVDELACSNTYRVLRARDMALEESEILVKLIHPHLISDLKVRQGLKTAILATRQLSHPNIVRVFDYENPTDEVHFITMEYVVGWNLRRVLDSRSKHRLNFSVALQFFFDIARALAYAHQKKLLHQDLKPSNILISNEGELKVTDFSVSRALQCEAGLTITGKTITSPAYMAPEQFLNHPPASSADVYSLGTIGYELFTGKPLVLGTNYLDLARTHMGDLTAVLKKKQDPMPVWLDALIQECLQTDATNRPESAEEVVNRIRENSSSKEARVSNRILKKQLPSKNPGFLRSIRRGWMAVAALVMMVVLSVTLYQSNVRHRAAPYYLRLENSLGLNFSFFRRNVFYVKDPLSNPDCLFEQLEFMGHNADRIHGLEALLKVGANPLRRDSTGKTVFHLWINEQIVQSYWITLMSPYLPFSVADNNGQTILHRASLTQDKESFTSVLRQGKDLSFRDKLGYTAFHLVVSKHRQDLIETFLETPGFFIDQRTFDGKTPLMLSVSIFPNEQTALGTVKLLLSRNPKLDAQDNQGKTILHYAVENELTGVVDELIKEGADPLIGDQTGKTAIDYAQEKSNPALIAILVERWSGVRNSRKRRK